MKREGGLVGEVDLAEFKDLKYVNASLEELKSVLGYFLPLRTEEQN